MTQQPIEVQAQDLKKGDIVVTGKGVQTVDSVDTEYDNKVLIEFEDDPTVWTAAPGQYFRVLLNSTNDSTTIWNTWDGKHHFNVEGWVVTETRGGTVDLFNPHTGDQFYIRASALRNIAKELKS